MGKRPKRITPNPTSEYHVTPLQGGPLNTGPRPADAVANIPSTRNRPPEGFSSWDSWRQVRSRELDARQEAARAAERRSERQRNAAERLFDLDDEPAGPPEVIGPETNRVLQDLHRRLTSGGELTSEEALQYASRLEATGEHCPRCQSPLAAPRGDSAIVQYTCGTQEDAAIGVLHWGDACETDDGRERWTLAEDGLPVIRNSGPVPTPPVINIPKPTIKVLLEYQQMFDTFEITFLESLVTGSMTMVGGELRFQLPLGLDRVRRLQNELGVFGAGVIMGIAPLPGITYMSIPDNQFSLNVHKSKLHDWTTLVPAMMQVIEFVWLQAFKETPIFAPRTDPFAATSTPEPPGESLRRLEP